jgi:aspartyl/asparaginyl-tRNA synthetase
MNAAAAVPHAAVFTCPGRPRPLARRLAIHNRVLKQVRGFFENESYNEIPVSALAPLGTACEAVDTAFTVDHCGHLSFARQSAQLTLDGLVARGFPAVWCESESLRREWKADERHLTGFKLVEAVRQDLDLDGLCDLQAGLLRHVAGTLGADLLGGRHVTRLDRLLRAELPRLTYREALDVLNGRGWSMPFGEDLHRDAEATLIRYCGHLPVLVTHLPADLKPFNLCRDPDDPQVALSVELILPWAGETADGGVYETDAEVMRERLHASNSYRQHLLRADDFARQQVAARQAGEDGPDAETLAGRHRAAVRRAFDDYLEPFAERALPRAGFALGFARLLQFLQGLDSIRDAVIQPQDRNSFGRGAGGAAAQAGEGAVTA